MSLKAETKFKNYIRPKLNKLPNTWVVKIQQVALRGTPDFLLCVNGWFVALELKKDALEEPDPLQRHRLLNIVNSNGIAFVVYPENWEEIYAQLKKLACGEARGFSNIASN